MCKGKVLLGIILSVTAVGLLGITLLGTNAGAQCCGPAKTTAAKTATAEAPAGCPVRKVTTTTVSPSSAGGTSKAAACCGTCSKASSCSARKVCAISPACCPKAGTAQCCATGKEKVVKNRSSLTLQEIHAHQLPNALKSIDAALKALNKGDQATAVRHVTTARMNIQTAHVALAKHVEPTFVNAVCPLMGSPIKPEKVTAGLTREYKGQQVAFCCAGCPGAWDKLTDTQKEEKLAKAKVKASLLTGLKLKP